MTTSKEYMSVEHLQQRAAVHGFAVTPGLDGIYLTPVPARWPDLVETPIRCFVSCEEACAWLDGAAWAQFMERSRG